jgi:ring-1,2-phenylacetyl-CoA epoxidase subunit PaaD
MVYKNVHITDDEVWKALEEVRDPEIPVLSLVEMKIVRNVEVHGDKVEIVITPTFAGCPALHQMQHDIKDKLYHLGFAKVDIEVSYEKPWSTNELSEESKKKLNDFGIAPPSKHAGDPTVTINLQVACPFCNSKNTVMENAFGPTLCRMIYYCNSCSQSFERFKAL